MNRPFKLNEFKIDPSRCSIKSLEDEQIIEPKVMDVLVFLASKAGEVVSQEELFKSVWPNSIFNPSSIQRSIALIRKAFNENAKSPTILKTHAKRGYCLEGTIEAFEKTQPGLPFPPLYWKSFIALFFVIFVSYWLFNSLDMEEKTEENKANSQSQPKFSTLIPAPLKSKDAFSLSYAPNDKLIAYLQQNDTGGSQIRIYDISSGEDYQLTKKSMEFTSLNWSLNGKRLHIRYNRKKKQFISQLSCFSKQCKTNDVDFKSSIEINHQKLISKIESTDDSLLYFLTRAINNNIDKLTIYNNLTKQFSTIITAKTNTHFIELSLSPNGKQIALALDVKANNYSIEIIDIDSKKRERLVLLKNRINSIDWHPNGQSIIVSQREKIKSINLSGDIKDINFSNYQTIVNAQYNNLGNEIRMTLINLDIDIMELNLNATNNEQPFINKTINSDQLDIGATYSPIDNRYAFQSNRNGIMQLWLKDKNQERLIFANDENIEFFGFAWSPDGKEIAIAGEKQLFIINTFDKSYAGFNHNSKTFYLKDWFYQSNSLLVKTQTKKGAVPAIYNLITRKLSIISTQVLSYPQLSTNDEVYISQNNSISRVDSKLKNTLIWHSENGELHGFSIIKEKLIIAEEVDNSSIIWSLNLEDKQIKELYKFPDSKMHFLHSNHNGNRLLFHSPFKRKVSHVRLK